MNAKDAFVRAALYESCKKSSILRNINVSEADIHTLRELINRQNSLSLREFPILISKLAIRIITGCLIKRFPTLSKWINENNIQIRIEEDESVYLYETVKSSKPNLYFIVLKNIVINLFGASLENLKDRLVSQCSSLDDSKEKNADDGNTAKSTTSSQESFDIPKIKVSNIELKPIVPQIPKTFDFPTIQSSSQNDMIQNYNRNNNIIRKRKISEVYNHDNIENEQEDLTSTTTTTNIHNHNDADSDDNLIQETIEKSPAKKLCRSTSSVTSCEEDETPSESQKMLEEDEFYDGNLQSTYDNNNNNYKTNVFDCDDVDNAGENKSQKNSDNVSEQEHSDLDESSIIESMETVDENPTDTTIKPNDPSESIQIVDGTNKSDSKITILNDIILNHANNSRGSGDDDDDDDYDVKEDVDSDNVKTLATKANDDLLKKEPNKKLQSSYVDLFETHIKDSSSISLNANIDTLKSARMKPNIESFEDIVISPNKSSGTIISNNNNNNKSDDIDYIPTAEIEKLLNLKQLNASSKNKRQASLHEDHISIASSSNETHNSGFDVSDNDEFLASVTNDYDNDEEEDNDDNQDIFIFNE